tara:strand:- start:664 stop:1350 length:687 start_codon:yes stop_codon:yes gene_type:complete
MLVNKNKVVRQINSLEQTTSEIDFQTNGEGFTDITPKIKAWITSNKINNGILIISILHTSCSLIVNENADSRVLRDLSKYMKALVPEVSFKSLNGKGFSEFYSHKDEGLDDMPAHIRTALTNTSLSFSVISGELVLGTWQAIYLWEHRDNKHTRRIQLHAIGELNSPELDTERSNNMALISRRNPNKLNDLIKNNTNENENTDIDLIVDRIHELTDNQQNQKNYQDKQ